jgi:hypothetical protein
MKNINLSSLEIKSEMQKVNVHIPPENRMRNHIIPGEEAAVARAVAREREYFDEQERRVQAERAQIENERARNRRERIRRHECRRRCSRDECRYYNDDVREIEVIPEFVDPTIYYRFVNQTFYNNLTGRSNINITELAQKSRNGQEQIEDILKKYSSRA